MGTYDRILKFNDSKKDCIDCVGSDMCNEWHEELGHGVNGKTCTTNSEYYANRDQLTALIKKAESGWHAWVRDNTMFVCSESEQCNSKDGFCGHKKPHKWSVENECPGVCKYHNKKGLCLPYRGTKSEEKTWPGINGETHQEALKDLGRNDEDLSSVPAQQFVCINRLTGQDDGCLDCNGGSPHEYFDGPECYDSVVWVPDDEDCSEVESCPKWDDDGQMCDTCKIVPEEGKCDNFTDHTCSLENDMSMYEREKTYGSDLKYNDNKQALKNAGEDVLKEESREMGTKLVALREIDCQLLGFCNDITDDAFREIYNTSPALNIKPGDIITNKHVLWIISDELVKLGFLEENVEDPVVKSGDAFERGGIIFIIFALGERSINLMNTRHFLPWLTPIPAYAKGCNLSDLVGKERLKEFKPVKVKIEVVED